MSDATHQPNVISNEHDLDMEGQEEHEVEPLGSHNLNVGMNEPRQCSTEHKMTAISRAVKQKHRRRGAAAPGLESYYEDTAKATRSLFQQ